MNSTNRDTIWDAAEMRVSMFTEPFDTMVKRRGKGSNGSRPIDEKRRRAAARAGFHAERVVVFPLGGILNGTLAQVEALATRRQSFRRPLGDRHHQPGVRRVADRVQ